MNDSESVPDVITDEWIAEKQNVFPAIECYMMKITEPLNSGKSYESFFEKLPGGYRLLFVHLRLWSDVGNGGFDQFIGNALSFDETGKILVDTINMLKRCGITELLAILFDAIALWPDDLPHLVLDAVPAMVASDARSKVRSRTMSEEELEDAFFELHLKVRALNRSWFETLERYVKVHPTEFVHPGSKK